MPPVYTGSSIFRRSAILTPFPFSLGCEEYIKGISEYRRTVSFSIPVYALPRLSPLQNRWYWMYVEVLPSVKLSSEVFLWASIPRGIGASDMMDGHGVLVSS